MYWLRSAFAVLCLFVACSALLAEEDESVFAEQGCSFKSDPAEFLKLQSQGRMDAYERTGKLASMRREGATPVPADSISRKTFIDDHIFNRLLKESVRVAPMSSDEEFVRRVYLDIIGRIPAADDVTSFVNEAASDKRARLIERLLTAPEFVDKWTVWMMDLVGMTESPSTGNRRPQIEGRIAFHTYLQHAISNAKPIREIAYDLITAKGINYLAENGQASYPVLASAAMGPIQDTYDLMLYRTATAFLGMAHYDCLLCHNGRGHLDQLSLWATKSTRIQAQRMAAHFARMRLNAVPNTTRYEHPLYNSTDVQDAVTGNYDLNTNFGNRPGRCANALPLNDQGRCIATQAITPEYRDGSTPKDGNWRAAFASKMIDDPLFGINLANRLWKQFFGLGLVDPVDTLDPERLDPQSPPPAPWQLQASHPELLVELGRNFVEGNTDLRSFIRTLVSSSAYQLSSRYDGPWKLEYVPLYARHYPRRLQAEEVHDAVVKATGMIQPYTYPIVNGQTVTQGSALPQSAPVEWAMKLPDINEPRNNAGNGNVFMSAFHRGNRDTAQRSSAGSILQQLNLMNDQFVTNRIKIPASPKLREIAKLTDNAALVDELFLTFLSRRPNDSERLRAIDHLKEQSTATGRVNAIQDLAWVCVNKIDFLFSY